MVDDDRTAIRLPFAADDADNFVVGLAVDLSAGDAVPVEDPLTETPRPLPPSPILILATSDAKLRLFTFSNTEPSDCLVEPPQPLPEPAALPQQGSAAAAHPGAPDVDALTELAKTAALGDDDSDFDDDSDEDTDSAEGIRCHQVSGITDSPSSDGNEAAPAAASGWGSSFLSANKAQTDAASDAAKKYVEESKGGAAAPFSSTPATGGFSFGLPTESKPAAAAPASSAAPAAASGWGSSFLSANKAQTDAASDAAKKYVEESKGGASAPFSSTPATGGFSFGLPTETKAAPASSPAPAASGWGSSFLSANKAQTDAASDAAKKYVEESKGGAAAPFSSTPATGGFSFGLPTESKAEAAPAPASSPAPAASGWGSDFLSSNKAQTDAASDAAKKYVEESKGGAAAPFSSTPATGGFSFGLPTESKPAVAAPASSAAPAAASGWGSSFLSANKAQTDAASDAAKKYVEESKGGTAAPFSSTPATGGFSFGLQTEPKPAESAPAPASSPAPAAASGWGSSFLSANKAQTDAASDAAKKYVEESKGGAAAPSSTPSSGGFGFGLPVDSKPAGATGAMLPRLFWVPGRGGEGFSAASGGKQAGPCYLTEGLSLLGCRAHRYQVRHSRIGHCLPAGQQGGINC